MRVLLLSNQPERTTRLMMFKGTLEGLGFDVIVPRFSTRSWLGVAKEARQALQREKPDVVQLFNVPDIIYHGLTKLKGSCFQKLIYDYRSPWGVELQMAFGPVARPVGEHFERELAKGSDLITAVNRPLADKAASYKEAEGKPLFIVPNYPAQSFLEMSERSSNQKVPEEEAIIFMGRISRQEGIGNLLGLIRNIPEQQFWIIGDGPLSRWYLRKLPANARFFGWQPHENVAALIRKAKICLIPHSETLLTPYATDKSVWKLNEYLALGKIVVASGVTREENRKNLVVVKSRELRDAVRENLHREPERLGPEDYRFWDGNDKIIREVYESL
ncbi:MAG: glycosyltransferase [Methanothrix sp.]|nr:glycosyltransferase [Methanothrix sp.]